MKNNFKLLWFSLLLAALSVLQSALFAQGTAFTYQGRLNDNGSLPTGLYDFQFTIYDAAANGNAISGVQTAAGVAVSNGLFTLTLDYGPGPFNGPARWVEIAARTNGGAGFTTLSPRQALTASPYAIFAGGANAAGLTGAIPPASIGQGSITGNQLAAGAAAANLAVNGSGVVPSGGIVLSQLPADTNFLNAGFVSLGTSNVLATNSWASLPAGPPPVGVASEGRGGHRAVWTGSAMLVIGGDPVSAGLSYNPASNTWVALNTTNAPAIGANVVAVWTGTRMLVFDAIHGVGGSYNPSNDTWQAISTVNAPAEAQVAVWTGTYLVVWGRTPVAPGGVVTNTGGGGRYNPTTDTWSPVSDVNNPLARTGGESVVWSGSEMIVFGGTVGNGFGLVFEDGGRYNPVSDTWVPLVIQPRREAHSAVWTGSRMIVWGGVVYDTNYGLLYTNSGFSYDPISDSSTPISMTGAPSARAGQDAVWTGSQMIIWNGSSNPVPDGGRYTPGTDSWSAMAASGEPNLHGSESAIWTGTQMIVWGGNDGGNEDTGGRYNPGADSWSATSAPSFYSEPGPRAQASAVWTGNSVIVWGGTSTNGWLRSGGIYNPNTGWTATTLTGAPSARTGHTAVWTGTDMIIWGGQGNVSVNTGARFNVASNAWFPISTTNAPRARAFHTAVWTGTEMIVFGGYDLTNLFYPTFLNDGARYNPATDTWTNLPLFMVFASARASHTAVWTGTEMIIWGGYTDTGGISPVFNYISTGARYNPATNGWTALPFGGPVGRRFHTAVWTGNDMIIWGGQTSTGSTNVGARFNPGSNVWTALPTNGASSVRERHTAVWNSQLKQMLVVGGYSSAIGTTLDTGAFYDATLNTWTVMPPIPSGMRMDHAAVWTGTQMIVLDGNQFPGYLNSVSAYTPAKIYYFYQKP